MLNDDYSVYILQINQIHRISRVGTWFDANLDHFGHPAGFKSSDPCWQTTGIHGTFVKAEGVRALEEIILAHPGHVWRLVERRLSQKTVSLFTAEK